MLNLLEIPRGTTALIGSGGKTTLLYLLARILSGKNILCTTTKIYRPSEFPVFTGKNLTEIAQALRNTPAVCVGTEVSDRKLGTPLCPLDSLREMCDHLIVEADGSRKLPLKAHLPHEPVIPPGCDKTILVAGLQGLGLSIAEAAHRPERFAELCGKSISDHVTPEDVATVILAEGVPDLCILNQIDTGDYTQSIRTIAALLPCPVLGASLQNGFLTTP